MPLLVHFWQARGLPPVLPDEHERAAGRERRSDEARAALAPLSLSLSPSLSLSLPLSLSLSLPLPPILRFRTKEDWLPGAVCNYAKARRDELFQDFINYRCVYVNIYIYIYI